MRKYPYHAAAVILLAIFAAQVLLGMRQLSASRDESLHIGAGVSYLATAELRLNPEHPPFVKELCALPLLFEDVNIDFHDPDWISDPPNQRAFAEHFLYSNNVDRVLFLSRLPVVFLALLLGWYIYGWSRVVFGPIAGIVALTLFSFNAQIIAHSRFVTMDVPLSCFFFISCYYLWSYLGYRSTGSLVLCGLFTGLALATKYSAIILLPVHAIVIARAVLIWKRSEDLLMPRKPYRFAILMYLAIYFIAALVVWVAYLFPGDLAFYFKGGIHLDEGDDANTLSYLMGHFKEGSFLFYYPVAFLVKTSEVLLILLFLAWLLWRSNATGNLVDSFCIIFPPVAFFLFATACAGDHGLRYLLPIYPFIFLYVSSLVRSFMQTKATRFLGILLIAWYAIWTISIHPHELAYFNRLIGGPAHGYKWLGESNIDWGQDMKLLKKHLEEKHYGEIKLHTSDSTNPGYYGIDYENLRKGDWIGKPYPGYYAVNINVLLRGLYVSDQEAVMSDWLHRYQPVDRVGYSHFIYKF